MRSPTPSLFDFLGVKSCIELNCEKSAHKITVQNMYIEGAGLSPGGLSMPIFFGYVVSPLTFSPLDVFTARSFPR